MESNVRPLIAAARALLATVGVAARSSASVSEGGLTVAR